MSDRTSQAVSARDANQHFSQLLRRVEAGEEVAITRRGTVVARLVPAVDDADQRARAIERLQQMDELFV